MEYKGGKVLIFPDYTSEVMAQRCAFREVQQALRDEGIKHTLRYPARLCLPPRQGSGQDLRGPEGGGEVPGKGKTYEKGSRSIHFTVALK